MIQRILLTIIVVLIAGIVITTAVGFLTRRAVPGKNLRIQEYPAADAPAPPETAAPGRASYMGLAHIRTVTKPDPSSGSDIGTSVVISPWFTYPADDAVFYEELARKSGVLQTVVRSYISEHTAAELQRAGEQRVKRDMLKRLNEHLTFGQLQDLYFTDYAFLE